MTEATEARRKYRNPMADLPDQALFFSFFAVGGIAICTLKYFGLHQLIVTAVPSALMLIYAGLSFITKRYRLREDKVGDNIYYLGFLYTLVSLAYALSIYDPQGNGAIQIITNFGIAIATTIIGLAGRVFFNQMRQDPVEYEREARYSLAEASSALRSQLSDISTDMSVFKRTIVQITEEGVTDVSNAARASMSENVERLASTAQEVINKIEIAFGAFTDHSTTLNEVEAKNVKALQSLFERIEKIEASPELLVAKFDPIIAKFDEVATETAARSKGQTADLKRLRNMIETSTAAAEALSQRFAMLSSSFNEQTDAFATRLQAASLASEHFARGMDESVAKMERHALAATEISQNLQSDLMERNTSSHALHEKMRADVESMERHRQAMETLLVESRDSVKLLQDALVSLSQQLVEQIHAR